MIEVVGSVAGILTTISFLPQAIKIIQTKHTKDLSLPMYAALTAGVFLWLVYGILQQSISVIVANAVTLVFASMILTLKIKYG